MARVTCIDKSPDSAGVPAMPGSQLTRLLSYDKYIGPLRANSGYKVDLVHLPLPLRLSVTIQYGADVRGEPGERRGERRWGLLVLPIVPGLKKNRRQKS